MAKRIVSCVGNAALTSIAGEFPAIALRVPNVGPNAARMQGRLVSLKRVEFYTTSAAMLVKYGILNTAAAGAAFADAGSVTAMDDRLIVTTQFPGCGMQQDSILIASTYFGTAQQYGTRPLAQNAVQILDFAALTAFNLSVRARGDECRFVIEGQTANTFLEMTAYWDEIEL